MNSKITMFMIFIFAWLLVISLYAIKEHMVLMEGFFPLATGVWEWTVTLQYTPFQESQVIPCSTCNSIINNKGCFWFGLLNMPNCKTDVKHPDLHKNAQLVQVN